MNIYWVGETSEVFIGNSLDEIKQQFYTEEEWMDLDGEYGEIHDLNMDAQVHDEDREFIGPPLSVKMYLSYFTSPNQVFSSY